MKNIFSTTPSYLNYDKPLSFSNKILWFYNNFLINLNPNSNIDNKIEFIKFKPNQHLQYLNKISFENSPLRFLTDLFIHSINWEEIYSKINNFKFLEIGCGRGIYGKLLSQILSEKFSTYVGIDPIPRNEWKSFSQNFKFFEDISENVKSYINNSNFLLTITAIEHFEKDLKFFQDISDYLKKEKRPFMQVHIMPAYPCLRTYLGHGFRQYSPKLISKITRLFDNNTKKTVIKLGDYRYNNLTFEYITKPRIFKKEDKRKKDSILYKKNLSKLLKENKLKNNKCTAYALILETNLKKNIKIL